ncbi:unnamed protein product [Colias eurytheme]|nr:unnamed protein product [Colias eurytheme]
MIQPVTIGKERCRRHLRMLGFRVLVAVHGWHSGSDISKVLETRSPSDRALSSFDDERYFQSLEALSGSIAA